MKIAGIEWKGYAALAPMAGVADRAFRELCVSFGAAFTVTEMVSAKGITMGDRKSADLLKISDIERPCAAQIFGDDPVIMAKAAEKVMVYHPDAIDINMGCPAPKISGNGGGSALLKNPELASDIVRAVCRSVDVPVTVKIRTGWNSDSINCVEIAKLCEEAGAAAITVHGRTKEQMYAPPVDFSAIKSVKESVSVPVIANGDVIDGPSAESMLKITGCDAVMIGRGALGRPWVFRAVNEYFLTGNILPEPPIEFRMETMLGHIKKICDYKGEKRGMLEARKHAAWYVKGIKGAAALRREICSLNTFGDIEAIADRIVAHCSVSEASEELSD